MHTSVLELASFPHTIFDLAYFFLILEEEVGGFVIARNLSGEQQVVDEFERGSKPVEVISAKLETPEVILGVPWVLSLIMVRDRIQGSSILRIISGDDADNVRVWPHDDPSVASWDAPPPVVGDDAGHEVGPAVEIEA